MKVTGANGFNESFSIESQSSSSLVANSIKNISFIAGEIFSLIISDAQGASTFQITVTIQDGSITAAKLSDMSAQAGDALVYDGSSWGPAPLDGLSYKGSYSASAGGDNTTEIPSSGHFYIVTSAGSNDPEGGTGGPTFSIGDWAVYNGSDWTKVVGSTDVVSVAGKTGAVTLEWSDISKTGSAVGDLANVNTSGATSGQVLKYDGSNWVADDEQTSGDFMADGTVAMTGDLDLGSNNLTNIASIDLNGGTLNDSSGNITLDTGLDSNGNDITTNAGNIDTGGGNIDLNGGFLTDAGGTVGVDVDLDVTGAISKGSGTFDIPHPDPMKKRKGMRLRHSFVESPNRGDNIYRWEIKTEGGKAKIKLPSYFKHLNENSQIWVNAKDHFGRAYGKVSANQKWLNITSNNDGVYNVLLIATRKDSVAKKGWDSKGPGPEYYRKPAQGR